MRADRLAGALRDNLRRRKQIRETVSVQADKVSESTKPGKPGEFFAGRGAKE